MSGHDPGVASAAERAMQLNSAEAPLLANRGKLRLGTASWTDPTMTKPGVFYPRGTSSAESRLKYYAQKFSVVEVNTSYYAIPERKTVESWAESTPDHFRFD